MTNNLACSNQAVLATANKLLEVTNIGRVSKAACCSLTASVQFHPFNVLVSDCVNTFLKNGHHYVDETIWNVASNHPINIIRNKFLFISGSTGCDSTGIHDCNAFWVKGVARNKHFGSQRDCMALHFGIKAALTAVHFGIQRFCMVIHSEIQRAVDFGIPG